MNIRYLKISKFSAQFIYEVKLVEIHIENGKKNQNRKRNEIFFFSKCPQKSENPPKIIKMYSKNFKFPKF